MRSRSRSGRESEFVAVSIPSWINSTGICIGGWTSDRPVPTPVPFQRSDDWMTGIGLTRDFPNGYLVPKPLLARRVACPLRLIASAKAPARWLAFLYSD